MTDRLEGALAALDEVPVPVTWADVEARLAESSGTPELRADLVAGEPDPHEVRHRRPVVRWAVALAAAAALVLVAIVAWPTGDAHTDTGPSATTASLPPSTTIPPSTTTPPPPAAAGPRALAATVVAGGRYYVWGGEAGDDSTPRADGFVVEDAGAGVRGVGDAPIAARSDAAGVWTGEDLIVCCGSGQADGLTADSRSAAAWNPASGRWRALGRPPAGVARSEVAAVWTGELMVVVAAGPAAATYDPATDKWATIPAPPDLAGVGDAVWTGEEVVVWDARYGTQEYPADGALEDRGWRWVPGRPSWEPLPDLPDGSRVALGTMVWTGDEIVVWGQSTANYGRGVGARWRPGQTAWVALPHSPQPEFDDVDGTPGSQSAAVDPASGDVIVRGLSGRDSGPTIPLYRYEPAAGRWSEAGIGLAGYAPAFAVLDGQVVVPDPAAPVAGRLPDG